MAIDPSIPLSVRAPQLPTPGQALELRQIALQMQDQQRARQQQQAILQLNQVPGMRSPSGLPTDQYIMALARINPMLADKTIQERATILASQSLEKQRDEEQRRKRDEAAQGKKQDILKSALSTYYSTEGDEEHKQRAFKESIKKQTEELRNSGAGLEYGWNDAKLEHMANSYPSISDAEGFVLSPKDIIERADIKQAAKVAAGGAVPLAQVGQPQPTGPQPTPDSGPIDKVTGQPITESVDSKSGAIVRSIDLTPIEGKEIKEEEPDPEEQPGPGEREYKVKDGKVEEVEVVAKPGPESEETPDTLRIKAEQEDARAERLMRLGTKTGNAQAKIASERARSYRAASTALQTRYDTESKEERLKTKDQETVLRLAGTQQPLPEETLQRIAKQYIAGDHSAMVGMARNQTAQAQIQNAITKEMQAQNKTPQEINAAKLRFTSMMQAERTLGSREANLAIANQELSGFIPLAREASKAVPRSEFMPLSKLETIARNQWSPAQRNLYVRTQGVLNAYAAVISRGVPTVYSQQQAKELLSAADTPQQFEAALQALTSESNIAGRAPHQVRDIFEGEVTGKNIKEGGEPPAKPMTYDDPNKERRYREWLRTHPR